MGEFLGIWLVVKVGEDSRTNVQRIAAAAGISVHYSGEFSLNSHFTHATSSEYKPLLILTIVQVQCFASGFSPVAL
jgi:hypothetical protein